MLITKVNQCYSKLINFNQLINIDQQKNPQIYWLTSINL